MNYIKLGEIATITNGKRNAQDATENGKYPLFDRSTIVKRSDKYLYDKEAILVPGEGRTFVPKYYKGKFDLHQRCYAIFDLNLEYDVRFIYLYILWNQAYFQSVYTGSTVPSLRLGNFEKMPIPVYSLPEQQKIAAHLDSIQSAIDNKKQQLQQLDELVKSKFVEMFGDVVQNSKNWDLIEFEQLGELARGVSKHRPRGAPELLDGKYPLIQTGDVANCDTYITEYTSTYSELGLAQSKMWKAGCLCITIAANIAKTGILTFDACFPDSVVGFIPNEKVNELYMHLWFSFFQSILEYQAPQTAQKNLNMATLGKLKICVPPIELQNTFAKYVQKIDSAKLIIKTQLVDLQELLDSKMDEYFGE